MTRAFDVVVRRGSLTEGDDTLLVNASNTGVWLGSGVSAAIARACGPGYQERIRAQLEAVYGGEMEPGQVLVTDAGAHPRARWVAHVAVMDYRSGHQGSTGPTLDTIRVATRNLWRACESLPGGLRVAMVALGAGVGGLGVRGPTEIACDTLLAHLGETVTTSIASVTFYGYLTHEYEAVAEVVTSRFPDAQRA